MLSCQTKACRKNHSSRPLILPSQMFKLWLLYLSTCNFKNFQHVVPGLRSEFGTQLIQDQGTQRPSTQNQTPMVDDPSTSEGCHFQQMKIAWLRISRQGIAAQLCVSAKAKYQVNKSTEAGGLVFRAAILVETFLGCRKSKLSRISPLKLQSISHGRAGPGSVRRGSWPLCRFWPGHLQG